MGNTLSCQSGLVSLNAACRCSGEDDLEALFAILERWPSIIAPARRGNLVAVLATSGNRAALDRCFQLAR